MKVVEVGDNSIKLPNRLAGIKAVLKIVIHKKSQAHGPAF